MTPNQQLLLQAMDRLGMKDNDLRAGLAAIVGGESNFMAVRERGYSTTSNARIRSIFGAVRRLTDAELTALKADDERFFNFVYGPHTEAGRQLGNTEPGDGYKFRGNGAIQLTGRANHERYGRLIGRPKLVDDPDIARAPEISMAIAVAYMLDRYPPLAARLGKGWGTMKAAVGNSFGPPDDIKNTLYLQYRSSGAFNYRPREPFVPPTPQIKPAPTDPFTVDPGPDPGRHWFIKLLDALGAIFRR